MSAFIVNKSHINAIIAAGLNVQHKPFTWYHKGEDGELKHHQLTSTNANEIGQMLLDECVNSVHYRYQDDTIVSLPGRTNAQWLIPFECKPFVKIPTKIVALSIINCYEYQSCEHPEWKDSLAKSFCQALKEITIRELPGYDNAPWEWEDQEYYKTNELVRLV